MSGAPLTLLESARRLGNYRFVELACFETLGRRAPEVQPAEAAGFLAGAARAHGWRAALIEERLPVSVGLPRAEELTTSASAEAAAALEAVLGLPAGELAAALADRLYPELLATYRAHLAACSPAADPPVARLLRRLVADLEVLLDEARALAGRPASAEVAPAGRLFGALRAPG